MFNFFKKQKPDVQPEKEEDKADTPDIVAAVTYYMMLRNGLLEEDRTDLYLLLITKLASVFADSTKDEGDEDEPLISPSEVLD